MASELKKSVVSPSLQYLDLYNSQISLTHQFITVSLKPLNDCNATYYKPSFLSPRCSLRKVLQNSVGFVVSTCKTLYQVCYSILNITTMFLVSKSTLFNYWWTPKNAVCANLFRGQPCMFCQPTLYYYGNNNDIERDREPEAAIRAKSGLACK